MKSYDIFISYRREDGNAFARQMQLKLENYGYRVFLDVEELKDGVFDQRIIDAITGAKVFIALLTPRYLCRCANDEDWVRKEIECALQNEIHIVPINIDRLFKDFPEDCPLHVRGGIGQHQFSEVFTGQQFSTTMRDLDDNRLSPYIREGRAEGDGPVGGGSVVRIRPDMECRMLRFGEPVATLKAATYNKVTLRKGRHVFDFVSTECKDDHLEMTYDVSKDEDYFDVQLMPVKTARLQREESVRKREERNERARKFKGDFKVGLTDTWRWLRWLLLIYAVAFIVMIAIVNIAQREERLAAEAEQELNSTTSSPYEIGDYYNENGKEGVVFEVSADGHHGKIVSLYVVERRWCTKEQYDREIVVGASSMTDGKANTDKVMARSDSDVYPAFEWCRSKGQDWYLPAKDELESIYAAKEKINVTLERLGKIKLGGIRWHWSSTECDEFSAWGVYMGNGFAGNPDKSFSLYVRAVSAF